MENQYEFEAPEVFSAHAVGVPGKRTFFVALGRSDRWVRLWMEKEGLQAMALSILQLLLSITGRETEPPCGFSPAPESGAMASGLPAAELEAEEITLGYEPGKAVLEVAARAVGPQRQGTVKLRCLPSLSQMREFADSSLEVCAAGRPLCILCGGPMDPAGHVCPRNN